MTNNGNVKKSWTYISDFPILTSIYYGSIKVSGPFVETPCIFLCMQNINYAEISA